MVMLCELLVSQVCHRVNKMLFVIVILKLRNKPRWLNSELVHAGLMYTYKEMFDAKKDFPN